MRCNASPTTSTAAADCGPAPAASSDDGAAATRAFQVMLLSMVARPIADSLGPVGGIFAETLSRASLVDLKRRET